MTDLSTDFYDVPDNCQAETITGIRRTEPLTERQIAAFGFDSDSGDAFLIYTRAMMKPSTWTFRKKEVMNCAGIGETRWRRISKKLIGIGVLEIIRERKRGTISGTKMVFKSIDRPHYEHPPTLENAPEAFNSNASGKMPKKTLKATNDAETFNSNAYNTPVERYNKTITREAELSPRIDCPTIDDQRDQRERFLNLLPGVHTFQTFDDHESKDRSKARVIHNDTSDLDGHNLEGAGVFVTVNETNGKGRKGSDVVKVRAIFADLDGAPLEPVLADSPHLVVESSPGKYHCYWWVEDGFPLDGFRGVQQSIARKYGSDPTVIDLSRVLRVPGYFHLKGDEFMVQIRKESNHPPITYAEAVEMFPPKPRKQWEATSQPPEGTNSGPYRGTYGVAAGSRNNELMRCLGGMVKRGLSTGEMEEEAFKFGAACSPPMSETEIRHCLKSIGRYK